jgi:hypothetical protein
MLDDHRRKAVATVGDFSHRASLPAASLPSYPVTLTKPSQRFSARRKRVAVPVDCIGKQRFKRSGFVIG